MDEKVTSMDENINRSLNEKMQSPQEGFNSEINGTALLSNGEAGHKTESQTNGENSTNVTEHSDELNNVNNQRQDPPEITHITANIKPYSEIVEKLCQNAYKELVSSIKTLPSSNDPTRFYGNAFEEDLKRKKTLLELMVKIRNYFVKLYVLNKWSINSSHFSKLIDLLNWLRGQQIFFDSLVESIKRIKFDLNFAKLPNHDLITSFVVLNDAHYHNNNNSSLKNGNTRLSLLPTYNLLETKKISSKFLYKVLKNLNLLLHLKMSTLSLKCTNNFINSIVSRNSLIKDGKLFMSITNEFEVALTLVNIDKATDKPETTTDTLPNDSPISKKNAIFKNNSLENYVFIALNFKFKFGLDDLGNMIFNVDHSLPEYNLTNLKSFLNSQILYQTPEKALQSNKNPLVELYKYLHSYSLNYKLYLISNQLNMLINGVNPPSSSTGGMYGGSALNGANKLTWGSNLKYAYNPEKSLITIFYWTQKRYIKHKSYIQICVTEDEKSSSDKKLSLAWYKDGKLFNDHEFDTLFEQLENGLTIDANFLDELSTIRTTSSTEGYNKPVLDYQKFSIQTLLSLVLNKHVELIMNDIYNRWDAIIRKAKGLFESFVLEEHIVNKPAGAILEECEDETEENVKEGNSLKKAQTFIRSNFIKLQDKYYLLIKLNNYKIVYFSIDYLTGYSFFINPLPSVNSICSKYQFHNFVNIKNGTSNGNDIEREIRTGPIFLLPNNFSDMEESLVISHQLLIIRMELLRHETLKVLSVTGWINCPIINLDLSELAKLDKSTKYSVTDKHDASFTHTLAQYRNFWSLQYYQLKNWPNNWFLITLITNIDSKTSINKLFWLAQIKSVNNKWTITFQTKLKLTKSTPDLNYDSSLLLGKLATNKISVHIVMEELDSNKVKTHIPDNVNKSKVERLLKTIKFNKVVSMDNTNESDPQDKLLMIILDNRSLTPIENIKNNLVLTVELFNSKMKLNVYGQLKTTLNLTHDTLITDNESFIETDLTGQYFHIASVVDLNEQNFKAKKLIYFHKSYQLLQRFVRLLSLVDILTHALHGGPKNHSNFLKIYLDKVILLFNDSGQFIFKINDNKLSLELSNDNVHKIVAVPLQKLLNNQMGQNLTSQNKGTNRRTINNLAEVSKNFIALDFGKTFYFDTINLLVKYIRLTLPLVEALSQFEKKNEKRHQNATSVSALEKSSVDIKYHCSGHGLTDYTFIYDITKEARRQAEQNSNRVMHVISRSLIKVSMQFKVVRGKRYVMLQVYPVVIENQLNGVIRQPSPQQYKTLAMGLKKLLAELVVLLGKKGDIHFVGDCVSCEMKLFYDALNSLHERIIKKFR